MRVWSGMFGAVVGLVAMAACGGGGGSSSGGGGNPGGPTPPPAGGASATVSIVSDRGRQSFPPNPATVSAARTVT